MTSGRFDVIGIDQLRPSAFESVLLLVVNSSNVQSKDSDRFGVRECTDDFLRVVNLGQKPSLPSCASNVFVTHFEEEHLLHHLRGGQSEIEGEELDENERVQANFGKVSPRRSTVNWKICGWRCSFSRHRSARTRMD